MKHVAGKFSDSALNTLEGITSQVHHTIRGVAREIAWRKNENVVVPEHILEALGKAIEVIKELQNEHAQRYAGDVFKCNPTRVFHEPSGLRGESEVRQEDAVAVVGEKGGRF